MTRLLFFMFVFFLTAACTSAAVYSQTDPPPSPTQPQTSTLTPFPTKTPTIKPTSTPEPTPTFSPTFTPTLTPTIVGGGEAKIAFTAKDSQGNINLYIDGLFTMQPKLVSTINLPEQDQFSKMKWSPDGQKLIFTNGDDNQKRFLWLYDLATNTFQTLYEIPPGRYVEDITWPQDRETIIVTTANSRCCSPGLAYYQINLSTGTLNRLQLENAWINNVTRINNQAVCHDQRNPSVRLMQLNGHEGICYFPELDLYGGIKRGENWVDYDLLSEDGQVKKTLCRFPAGIYTNGAINLLLSPDQSRVLLIGTPTRLRGSYMENGIPFAIPIKLTDTFTNTIDPEALFYRESVIEATPPPHVLTIVYVYGWSPDSRNYAAARFFSDSYNRANYTAQGEFVIIHSDSGEVIHTYHFPGGLEQFLGDRFGFDLVWPERP
jgi:hypothetical protein